MTSINTNIGAMVAQKNMMDNSKELDNAMARISSGLRINSAKDDAAGSAIASKMESQVRSLGVAIRNANDAISLTQTAEGALGEVENIVQRMRELSVQAGNSTLNASDRSQIQSEMNQLAEEIDSISSKTNFNGVNLLNGSNAKVTMQIGINESDSLDIALQKTDVKALGIGNSGTASKATITSARISTLGATDITANSMKINGKDFTRSAFALSGTIQLDGQASALTLSGAPASGSLQSFAIAQKINENTGEHGVTATSYNTLTANISSYTASDVVINGTTIQSRSTQAQFVAAVNDEIVGVSANVNADGRVELSNTDGAAISIGSGGLETLGIAEVVYGGFVELSSVDGSDINIESGTAKNGYPNVSATTALTVGLFGFNEAKEVNGKHTVVGSGPADGTWLQSSDGLKINDVLITELSHQTSTSINATDKIAAINDKTAQTGVVATGANQVLLTVDLVSATMSNHSTAAINGITITMASVTTMNSLVTTINAGLSGKSSTVASIEATTGKLLLSNTDGGTITYDDTTGVTGAGAFFTAGTYVSTRALSTTHATGGGTAQGFITLTSENGSGIKIEDGIEDKLTDTGAVRIGFSSQNENGSTSSGVNVSSVAGANTSLAALDKALDTIANFRAGFGAYENRLDASINNLTTLQINTDAARSRIEDADFAKETTNMTKSQILSQAATSMLAQANSSKQNLLALLQG
jgi:flagellin